MIQKLIGALTVALVILTAAGPALAQTTTNAISTSTRANKATKSERGFQFNPQVVACIKTAIGTRDGAISQAVGVYSAAIQAALQTRQSALQAAWDKSTTKERRAAINAAWRNYRESSKSAQAALRNAKKEAWKKFFADRKTCHPNAAGEDRTTENVDTNL